MSKRWVRTFKNYWKKIALSLLLLIIAGIIDDLAGGYTTIKGSCASTDLLLGLIPPTDLTMVFVYGWLISIFFLFIYPLFFNLEKLHLVIYYFSLIAIVRSTFIIFTHLSTPHDAVPIQFPWPFSLLRFKNDLFFSGHTALPLVGFFVFKDKIRYVFLIISLIMAITVLAMHQHYSIDVLAAYFIAYGTFKIGNWIAQKSSVIKKMIV